MMRGPGDRETWASWSKGTVSSYKINAEDVMYSILTINKYCIVYFGLPK